MQSSKTYSHSDVIEDPITPVDFVVAMLVSLLITATAFPIGIAVALLHVLSTLVRNIPVCAMLAVGCVVMTSAVLIVSAAYVLFWAGLLGVQAVLAFKRAVEDSAALGKNMASLFIDEFTRERRKRWTSGGEYASE